MILIGITGRKYTGKSEVARILREEFKFVEVAFATPIKEIGAGVYGLTRDQLYGDQKEVLDPRWGKTPRQMMQEIGDKLREIGSARPDGQLDCLIGAAFDRLDRMEEDASSLGASLEGGCISDVRLPEEGTAIHLREGFVLRMERMGIDTGIRNDHITESAVERVPYDWCIHNNGTIEDLRAAVHAAMRSFQHIHDRTR